MEKDWLLHGGRYEAWPEWIAQIILELLSHKTPPYCIPANILLVAESLHRNCPIVTELPGLSFVQECCTVLCVTTKSLGAYFQGRQLQATILQWNKLSSNCNPECDHFFP